MSQSFRTEIDDRQVVDAFNRMIAASSDVTPATRAIAELLASRTEGNFAAEGGPAGPWPALAESTRERRGADARMLQDSGRLAASVTPFYGPDEAGIGSNAVYAAIHHFGGKAGRGVEVSIPARAYLPADGHGLQAGVGGEVMEIIANHLRGAVR